MNITEIDDALSAALHALCAAQATLRKGASTRDLDILRKADLAGAEPNVDPLALLADAERRMTAIEVQRAAELEQGEARKTYTTRFDS
jgi:hypothetical protein